MKLQQVFDNISDSYANYSKIRNQLQTNTVQFEDYKQLYINLFFELDYQIEMLFQDNDIELYAEDDLDEKDIMNNIGKTITPLTRFIHFLRMNELDTKEYYKYNELHEILNVLKNTYHALKHEDIDYRV